MTPPLLLEILSDYQIAGKAIPAFNIDSFEIYQAVEAAVKETGLPCIVQLSAGEDSFIEAEKLFLMVKKARLQGLLIYLNMDHGTNPDRLIQLAGLGFDMVHFDNSLTPYSQNLLTSQIFVKNLKKTAPISLVEVEFNHINLVGSKISSSSLTDPNQALEFMLTTNADLLAVSVGNLHGVSANIPEIIDNSLLSEIASHMPQHKYLTLHGGSGIAPNLIKTAIKTGIVKININTDLRLKFKQSLSQSVTSSPSEKIYEYLAPVITDVKTVVIQKLIQFSSSSS